MNVSRYVVGDYSAWVPVDEQVLGRLTSAGDSPPVSYEVRVPIRMDSTSVDVDNDGETDVGVQIFGLFVGSNLTGDSYLEQLDQTAYRSYLADPASGAIREGRFLVHSPDDEQGFPSAAGEDGVYFTRDDPVVGLPAGYTLATLDGDGQVTFDRSRVATMNTRERASTASPDFSALGLLESYEALIDLLQARYAYTALRNLDWEQIRRDYLPRVEAAEKAGDLAAYYVALTELALSIRDAHVYTKISDAAVKAVYWRGIDEQFAASVGASTAALSDGRYVVTYLVPEGPAARAGWAFGTEILSIDGEPIAERIERLPLLSPAGTPEAAQLVRLNLALNFPEGKAVRVDYRQPDEERIRRVTLTASKGLQFPASAASSGPISFRELEGGYGYVTWPLFRDPQYTLAIWERFLAGFRAAPGIVIDLRGNAGGNAELMYTMASYFFSKEEPASYHWVDRWYFDDVTGGLVKAFALDFPLYAPRPELRYDGAVVVLVDQSSASAGEYFPQFLQDHDRALVVDEHSSEGAGGAVEQVAMPGHMTFTFTKGRSYFAGTEELNLEAKGVALDVRVPITEDNERAKRAGDDPVLAAAVEVLAEEGVRIATGRIAGTDWRLQRILNAPGGSAQPQDPKGYTIAFAEDESLDVKTDCNLSKASYDVGIGGTLRKGRQRPRLPPARKALSATPL